MTEATKVTSGPIGVGTRFEATVLSQGTARPVTIEYTSFDRPHRIDSSSVMDVATVHGHVQCDPTPAGPRFSRDWTVAATGPAPHRRPTDRPDRTTPGRTIWTGLKRRLEHTDATG